MRQDMIDRALGYPYPLPGASYIIEQGAVQPLHEDDAERHREGRTPVLAIGSNQSPKQIARKFPEPDWAHIPCERCVLADFDTVYSAHITAYGSLPAALHPSPGTRVRLYVNWLDDRQLERMHETELGAGNYVFARLDGVSLETELGLALDAVHFYRANAGAYAPQGAPIPLAEVPAEARRWPALDQRTLQGRVHVETDPGRTFEEFVLSSIADEGERRRRAGRLRETSTPFTHEGLTVVLE